MEYYPLFLNIRKKRILVVGGGVVALRKIRLIVAAGAKPCVVAPQIHSEVIELVKCHQGEIYQRAFAAEDLDNVLLVFSATDNDELSQEIFQLACDRAIPINTVDNHNLCTFITPALIDREPLLIAFSTGGMAPVMARRLRADMEVQLPEKYGELVRFMGSLRSQVKKELAEDKRRLFYESLLDSQLPHFVYKGLEDEAKDLARRMMKEGGKGYGEVWLAGAGPGAAELLTLQTLRLMHQADIIFYDRLVNDEIMAMARRDADRVAVGKPGTSQEEINRLMIEQAKQGKQVLRLKGGDPAIYGRLSEEMAALKEAGISFHIAPGVTAALACAAYSGIPLTDRELAHGVSFLHFNNASLEVFKGLVQSNHTLVIYMGMEKIGDGVNILLDAGMAADTPALIVQEVGFHNQRRLKSSLAKLSQRAKQAGLSSPAVIIIGKVVTKNSDSN